MDQEGISQNFQEMKITDQDVNILLLGRTAVGKSTFINAFANYIEYDQFDIAERNGVRYVIPAKFSVTNNKSEEKMVEIGKDSNENNTIFESATLATRSYVFPKNGLRIRLIDTPGIVDTRGLNQDKENMENILSYISHLKYLHAICFLLAPSDCRKTIPYDYCIQQLLSRLNKSASENIIFLYTHSEYSSYTPGDARRALESVLESIKNRPPYVEIKFHKDNVFCLDNKSFRYLAAMKNGIEVDNKQSFADSWERSVRECKRMLHYISGKGNSTITPHKVQDTISINEARRVILQLSQPLADIADVINDNIRALERHNKILQMDNLSVEELKKNLYVPVMNIHCIELPHPVTVCTAKDCVEIYTVNDSKKCNYKQICHDRCYLTNVRKEFIGDPELMNCWAMTGSKCRICNCHFLTHMHIYYKCETYIDKITDQSVKAQIQNREDALNATKKTIAAIESKKLGYENEKQTIIVKMASYAHFLRRNAITAYNDAYEAYIKYSIAREELYGPDGDSELIKDYNDMLKRYNEEKKILGDALSSSSDSNLDVTATTVLDSVQHLYNLPIMGSKIRDMHTKMVRGQTNEHMKTEIEFEENKNKEIEEDNQNNINSKPKQLSNHTRKKGKNTTDQRHMKPKGRYSENNRGRHNNIPTQGFSQTNYQYNQPPNTVNIANFWVTPRPNPLSQPYQVYTGNFQNYPQQQQYHCPPNLLPPPPPFYPVNISNYGSQETQSRSGNYTNFTECNRTDVIKRKTPPTNTSNIVPDPNFEEWLENVLKGDTNNSQKKDNSVGTKQYNNLSKNHTSNNSNDLTQSNSEEEYFKEFMKKNNLE